MRTIHEIIVLSIALAATGCLSDSPEDETPDYSVSDQDRAADQEVDAATQDGKADSTLGYLSVARVAHAAGVACSGDRIALAVAVAKAESGFRTGATNTAGNSHGVDRGLWQINSYFHPDVSNACAFSASCNARAMASISHYGRTWSAWWTYNNGKHLPFMSAARSAQATVCNE